MTKLSMKILAACVLIAAHAHGDTVLYSDNFDSYTPGNLVGQGGWAAHSGAGTLPVQVNASGGIDLVHGASAEDVNHNVGAIMAAGDVWRYSIDVTVDTYSVPYYFAHFKDSGFGFNGRLHLDNSTGAGDFTFGVSDIGSDGGATSVFTGDFFFDTTYRVNVEYNYDLGTSTVTIDGVTGSITSTDADLMQSMEAIAFRQTSTGATGSSIMTIDNLEVVSVMTPIPEPSTAAVLGLGLAAISVRRRR